MRGGHRVSCGQGPIQVESHPGMGRGSGFRWGTRAAQERSSRLAGGRETAPTHASKHSAWSCTAPEGLSPEGVEAERGDRSRSERRYRSAGTTAVSMTGRSVWMS